MLRHRESPVAMILVLAAFAWSCGERTLPSGPSLPPKISALFEGVLAGPGGEIGVMTLNSASGGDMTNVTGTLTTWGVLRGWGTSTLTGTLRSTGAGMTTDTITVTGGGYSFAGSSTNVTASGAYTGPDGAGRFAALAPTDSARAFVSLCGTFSGFDRASIWPVPQFVSGVWNLERSDSVLFGVAVNNAPIGDVVPVVTLRGHVSGNNLSLTAQGPDGNPEGSADGTISVGAAGGTWVSADGLASGAWYANSAWCSRQQARPRVRYTLVFPVPQYEPGSEIATDTVCLGDSLEYKAFPLDSAGDLVPLSALGSLVVTWALSDITYGSLAGEINALDGIATEGFIADDTESPVFPLPSSTFVNATFSDAAASSSVLAHGSAYVTVRACALRGRYSGGWSGHSWPLPYLQTPVPVSGPMALVPGGTWKLDLQDVDLVGHTASGTLTWDGSDISWTVKRDSTTTPPRIDTLPTQFGVSRQIPFDASNSVVTLETCPREVHLGIDGFAKSSYGPFFSVKVTPEFAVIDGIDAGAYAVNGPYGSLTNTGFDPSSFGTSIGNVTGKQDSMYFTRDLSGDRTSWGGHLVGQCYPSSSAMARAQAGGRRGPFSSYQSRRNLGQQPFKRRGAR